ncbi:MAG: sugar-binding protein [Monoglobaceae bacterium]
MKNRFKGIGRVLVLQLVIIQILSCIIPFSVFAEDEYASVIFSSQNKTERLKVTESWTAVERMGRIGKRTNISGNALYAYVNVNDDFLYNLPEYTPIEITVEYFDEGTGSFALNYDSYNPWEGNDNWGEAETVNLTNTKQWLSYTFYLEDMRFTNKANSDDFRIGVWGNTMKFSKSDVIFGSITVRKAEYRDLLITKPVSSVKYGNVFDGSEPIELILDYTNKIDKAIEVEGSYSIVDENGSFVYSGEFKESFSPNEEKQISLKVEDKNKYGIYTVNIDIEEWFVDNPDSKISTHRTGEYSRVAKLAEEDINPNYGACQQVASLYRGDAETTSKMMREAGMNFVRDGNDWVRVEWNKGVYKMRDEDKEIFRKMKENGVTPLIVLAYENRNYDNGDTPHSDEAIQGFANYCAFMARELKGITNYFEIWNEYNIQEFNKTMEPPETYAKMIKAAYPAIKAENPDAVVIGIGTAEVQLEWMKRVFDAGAYDYMDMVSVHPYDWSFGTFRWDRMIEQNQQMKELMRQYGEEKPMAFTEVGFSSCPERFTELEQASNTVMLWALIKSEKMCDILTQYCFYDRWDRAEVEHNWGYLNYYEDETAPSGSKISYPAVCAMNSLIGDGVAEYKEHIRTDTNFHAFRFYNKKLGRDVMLINSYENSKYISYDLGCNTVELYDIYGNRVDEIYSESGVFTFSVGQVPQYVVGGFTKFAESEAEALVTALGETEITAVADDVVSFEFESKTDKNLNITVEENDVITVKENSGFADGKAQVLIGTSPKAKDRVSFNIKITDDEGKNYYAAQHTLAFTDEISATITAEPAVTGNTKYWRIRVGLKNMSKLKTMSGKVTVTEPEDTAKQMPTRTFEGLRPGEEKTLLINLPIRITKPTIDLGLRVTLDNGNYYDFSEQLDFGSASYANTKPVIDGEVSLSEWSGSWIGADSAKDIKEITDWRGADDLSFSGTAMWDEENFYLLAIVTDDLYSLDYSPKEPHYMYRGDNIQFGLNDKTIINTVEYGIFTEIGVAEVPGYGSVTYRYSSLYGLPAKQIIESAETAVKRYDTYTVYECKIPWSELFYEGWTPTANQKLRFSVMANDNDGSARRGWIEYTSGIGAYKDVSEFGSLVLAK